LLRGAAYYLVGSSEIEKWAGRNPTTLVFKPDERRVRIFLGYLVGLSDDLLVVQVRVSSPTSYAVQATGDPR